MDLERLKQAKKLVTGAKQTLKAIEGSRASEVFMARDAEQRVIRPVLERCTEKMIPVSYVDTMAELGKACGIKVKAAMAAILRES